MTQQTRDISNDMTVTRVTSTHCYCHNHHYRSCPGSNNNTPITPHSQSPQLYWRACTAEAHADDGLLHGHCAEGCSRALCVCLERDAHTHTHHCTIHIFISWSAQQHTRRFHSAPTCKEGIQPHDQHCPLYIGHVNMGTGTSCKRAPSQTAGTAVMNALTAPPLSAISTQNLLHSQFNKA